MYRFTIFLLFIGSFTTQGQEYQMDASLSTVNDCNGFFTDSGGSSGNYQNNENLSTIICKDPLEGTHIKLTFADIDLAPGDKLCFYDGLSTASDSIICIEYFFNGFPIIVQATAANPTGCLLVTFKSNDNGEVRSGWQAGIDCIPSCQAIQATIESTNPQAIPLERGFIDICEGERVFLNGNANYPQNNLVYEHNNTTSTFEWDFGDGTFAVGNNVSHVYRQAGGYQVSLKVTDQFGCTNGNFAFQRVRVATKPEFKIGAIPTEVCIGDSILLSGGIGENSNASTIAVCNQEGSFLFNGARSDSLALPDGNGASYKTSIRFTDFAAGQVLTDINDLQSLCLNMEHSWLHDMEISITCPSGNTVLLQSQEVINKEVYLGIPIDNDGITPQSGRGLDYCWSPTSKNGTLTEFANNDDDSSPNETYHLPAGDFNSFEDLEALLGCPLNGDWIITVTDLWEQDNGWIFSWSIDINPDLYPDLATFEPQITNYQWQNSPDFTSVTSELVVAQPTSAGDVNYIFEATDDFGCSHDTSIQITVLPNNHPDCLNCEDHLLQQKQVVICPETSLNLEAFIDPYALGVIDFRSFPEYEFSKTTHPPQNPYEAPIQVSNVPGGEIKPDGSNLIAVCLNLTSEFNSDLSITLISPNGVHLNLSSENGGRNDGYLNTCFTLSANRSITQTTDAPFTGNYQPEEPFSNLAGTDINGLWKLQLSDDAGSSVTDVNVLKNWSLTFLSPSGATFNWTPTETLSCSDCTNPTASPTVSTNYVLEKNFEGCQVFDTLKVTILGEDRPTNIKEVSLRAGNLLVNWDTLPNVNAFEVSINSVDWLPANNGLTSHIFSELTQNETFNVYVRGVYDGFPCASKFLSRAVRYRFCDLVADLGSQNLVTSCSGANDAFAVIVANGGSGGYTFTLNDSLTQFNNRFDNLTSGAYQVLITDNQSCADTLNFTVTAPPPLSLSFDKVDLGCFGDNNGSVTVFPSGGVGDYEVIQWSNTGSKNTALSNLSAGTYWVEMADANNCPIIDTFEMIEPTQLKALATATPITCFGAADGGVSVKVTDGTPPYNFDWNNGQTGVSILGLDVGNYSVTVADANNCKTERIITISDTEDIIVNIEKENISCPEASDGTLLGVVSGGIAPYTYNWNTGQTNQFNFGLPSAQYLLTVTDSKGCEKITNAELNEPNALIIATSFTPPSCENNSDGSATVDVTGGTGAYTFLWNDTLAQTTQTAINLVPANYEVTVSDSNGCAAIQTITVNPATAIITSFVTTPASCADSPNGSAVATIENGSGNYTFLWENGNTTATNTNLLSGKYTVTIQDGNACAIIDTIEITSPAVLLVDSIRQIIPDCNGAATGTLNAFVSGGTSPYSFNWDDNQTTANPYVGVIAGEHTLNVIDANGCTILPQIINLPEPAPISFTISQQNVLCFGEKDGTVTINPTGGIAPYSISWNDESNQTGETAIGLAAANYLLSVMDNNGCSHQMEVSITQPATPISSQFLQTDTACFKQPQNSAAIIPMGGTGTNYRFEWNTGENTAEVSNLMAGTYEVSIYDENNCEKVEILDIIELDSIAFSIIEVKPSCAESSNGQLAISPITGGGGNGQIDNYQINWSTAPTIHQEAIANLSGNTAYEVTVTDQLGCRQLIDRFLEAPEPIEIALDKQDISCFGADDGQLVITPLTGDFLIETYNWSANIPDGMTTIATNLTADTYTLSIIDEDGCLATATANISEPAPIKIENTEILPNICSDASLGKIFLTTSGGIGPFTYAWSNGSNDKNLSNVAAGTYHVNIKDTNNCVLIDSFDLTDPNALNATIEIMPISCFDDADGRLNITPAGGVPPYIYSLNGNDYDGISNIIGLSAGNYTVSIKDNNDCIWTSNLLNITNPLPFQVKISSDQTTIELGDSIDLTVDFFNNIGNIQYSWSANTPDTINCPIGLCDQISVKPTANTAYEIYAIDTNGCEAFDVHNILVAKSRKIFVPTGFTPNGDGQNDYLIVHGASNITIPSFKLFDRWGEAVFESNDLTPNNSKNTWDGTFKGQALTPGVYVWILEATFPDGSTEIFKGSTSLIR